MATLFKSRRNGQGGLTEIIWEYGTSASRLNILRSTMEPRYGDLLGRQQEVHLYECIRNLLLFYVDKFTTTLKKCTVLENWNSLYRGFTVIFRLCKPTLVELLPPLPAFFSFRARYRGHFGPCSSGLRRSRVARLAKSKKYPSNGGKIGQTVTKTKSRKGKSPQFLAFFNFFCIFINKLSAVTMAKKAVFLRLGLEKMPSWHL